MELVRLDDGVYTIEKLLNEKECLDLIDFSERQGFQPATVLTSKGPKMMTHVRNNQRVNFCDEKLTALLWERSKHLLPKVKDLHAVGLDSRLRIYRYQPGEKFNRHKDGKVQNEIGQTSQISFLIY